MSSAHRCVWPLSLRIEKSSTIIENSRGLRGDPSGTPTLSGRSSENKSPTLTQYVLPLSRLFSHPSICPVTPLPPNLYNSPYIQVVSNALATSRKTTYVFSSRIPLLD